MELPNHRLLDSFSVSLLSSTSILVAQELLLLSEKVYVCAFFFLKESDKNEDAKQDKKVGEGS